MGDDDAVYGDSNYDMIPSDWRDVPGSGKRAHALSFRLNGVRLDVNGLTASVAVAGSLSSSANNYLMGTSTATVISSLSPGIASMAIGGNAGNTNQGTATVFTNKNVVDSSASFVITEGFPSAWRSAAQNSNSKAAAPISPLDPVYSGKGLAGLIALIREGRWSAGDDVVFIHTGGSPALFAYQSALDI